MLNSYLLSLADKLDKSGQHKEADVIDNLRIAQVAMPAAYGAMYDKASAVAQEVQKLTTQQASMIKTVDSDIKELKEMRSTITRGARDFWKFRRSKYQSQQPVQPVTDMNAFGLRGAPAPQLRNSQTEVQPRSQYPAIGPVGYISFNDEIEEFFQWLESEQARKMQQGGDMFGGNMNLPFQIG